MFKNPLQFLLFYVIMDKEKDKDSNREGKTMTTAAIKYQAGTLTVTPAQEIGQQLFTDFIAFIDRTEKTARTYCTNLRQFMAWLRYAAISRPARQDVVNYREWLSAEHDAIELDAMQPAGWRYRTDSTGNRRTVTCKPNTIKQYLQSVKQFFTWTAANGLYPNIAANIHAPKITEMHRKDSLTAAEVQQIESITSLH